MKKLIIFLMILFVLSGCSRKVNSVAASNLEINNSMSHLTPLSIPIHYTSAYDEKTLKEMGIKLSSTNIVPKIGELEVRKIAEDLLRQTAVQPKSIYLEYGLITANVGIGGISAEAINANPVLKNKKSIVDVPVWVITLKGLLPDDYVPDHRGKEPLDISSTVIDANTGKALFGFGTGK
ncbi:hypothetical protein EHS13_33445 [Paenibacillus psychroresistens]|uniref:Uncharacterized protein n=1 Tax=Paenibacillus psychroresistens TaxID=1778678 RepID=A0A6B8RSL2_9BACL|nr:lipoprotein [Paenibacillus psychroresistens]QGQ99420.1 hypothetical protein EHS13_33445 [Paenibacillus psychroresistens]